MIQVIATIELNPGCRENFLPILKDNVPKVKAEDGCMAYDPFVDINSGLSVQGGSLTAPIYTYFASSYELQALS